MANLDVPRGVALGVTLCVFLGLFLFVLLYIDPPVLYSTNGFGLLSWVQSAHALGQQQGDASYLGTGHHPFYNLELTRTYFGSVFGRPGGFTFLAVGTLIAACHLPLLGAALIVLIGLWLFWAFPWYVKGSGGPALLINRWIPVLLVLLPCFVYDLSGFAFLIPIAGALTFAIVYQRIARGAGVKAVGLVILFLLCYYLFQWAALLFLLLVLIHEVVTQARTIAAPGIAALVALLLFYLFESRFIPVDYATRWPEFIAGTVPPLALVAYFPILALGVRIRLPRNIAHPVVRVVLLVLIAAAALYGSMTNPVLRETRAIGLTMHHMLNRQWNTIIREDAPAILKGKSPALLQILMVNVVDHALYETGRLGDEMFFFPQSLYFPESLLLMQSTLTSGFPNWVAALDLHMDLGTENFAEKVAGELMENMGAYPFLLERRALIQAAKGNEEAAAVYLHRLSGMPFHRQEARRLLTMIGNGTIMNDGRVGRLAACIDTSDYLIFHLSDDAILGNLLERNPRNRMAWEYLISYYLQTGQPARIIDQIGRFREFGYLELPQSWDEALCILLREDPSLNPQTLPVLPRQETMASYDRFLMECQRYGNSQPAEVIAALGPGFGSTYFFSYVFGFAPGSMK